jgi:hypothetical protein
MKTDEAAPRSAISQRESVALSWFRPSAVISQNSNMQTNSHITAVSNFMKFRLRFLRCLLTRKDNRTLMDRFFAEAPKRISKTSQFYRFGFPNVCNLARNNISLKKDSPKFRLQRALLRLQMHFTALPRSLVKTNKPGTNFLILFCLERSLCIWLPRGQCRFVWNANRLLIELQLTEWIGEKKLSRACLRDLGGT